MDVALEISLYIDRFHNLDLWQQGWYALKVTCEWEGSPQERGVPSRVVQYEGASDGLSTVWHINDSDHSFCTRPFKIKYSRQDVFLAVMVSFSLPIKSLKDVFQTSALIKCQLLYAPLDGFLLFNSMHIELPSVASHCYRLSARAMHGVHGYCPLHFDSTHMALVDLFVHTVILSVSHHEVHPETESSSRRKDNVQKLLLDSRNMLLAQLSSFGYDEDALKQLEQEMLETTSPVQEQKDLSMELSGLWNLFLKIHRRSRDSICKSLRRSWNQKRHTQCLRWVRHLELELVSNASKIDSLDRLAANRADVHRKSLMQSLLPACDLEDMQLFGKPLQQPVIFVEEEQIPADQSVDVGENSESDSTPLRLAVFVHGFQGHHLDLRLIRNQWLLADPGVEVLMSHANEERTSGDLSELGQRLADEVAQFINHKLNKASRRQQQQQQENSRKCRISFIGHSIGNLIIRAALTEAPLQPYLKYLHTFLSVSGPHLGYMYSSNSLFNSGMWILKKWKGSQCMHQLSFTDKPEMQECFLFKLSQEKTFEHFHHVILLSSPQDRYVPYHSARIETCPAAVRDSKRGSAYATMMHKCLAQLKKPSSRQRSFIRCDVNFDISAQARSFNNLIGRTAHIEFLETDAFIRFVMWTFPKCFS